MVDDIAIAIAQLGTGALLAKVDIEFRISADPGSSTEPAIASSTME